MAYKEFRGAIVLANYKGKKMYIGVIHPTSQLQELNGLDPKKEGIMEEFEGKRLEHVKEAIKERGDQLSNEDGLLFIPNF